MGRRLSRMVRGAGVRLKGLCKTFSVESRLEETVEVVGGCGLKRRALGFKMQVLLIYLHCQRRSAIREHVRRQARNHHVGPW